MENSTLVSKSVLGIENLFNLAFTLRTIITVYGTGRRSVGCIVQIDKVTSIEHLGLNKAVQVTLIISGCDNTS